MIADLARALGEAHRRYTRRINFRENRRGHLWLERFASFPMDEAPPTCSNTLRGKGSEASKKQAQSDR